MRNNSEHSNDLSIQIYNRKRNCILEFLSTSNIVQKSTTLNYLATDTTTDYYILFDSVIMILHPLYVTRSVRCVEIQRWIMI